MTNIKKTEPAESRVLQYTRVSTERAIFTTYDLGLATALLCADFELSSIDKKKRPRRALFIFKEDIRIKDVADKYVSNTLAIKARSFFDNLKALKNQLYF